MKLIRFLLKTSRRMTLLIAVAGLMSGLFSAGLIAVINASLHRKDGVPITLVAGVVLLGLGKILTGYLSQRLLVGFAQETLLDLSIGLCRRILVAPYRRLEELGPARILTTLTDDVLVLGAAIQMVPSLAMSGAVVLGCAAYLVWLSPLGFGALVIVLLIGVGIYQLLHARAYQAVALAREERDRLMGGFRSLTDGIKELKMNTARKNAFLDRSVDRVADKVRQYNLVAARKYLVLDAWSQGLFYLLIAIMLFVFPSLGKMSSEVMTGYVFASLYMMQPVWSMIGSLPTFFRGRVSLKKVEELGISLSAESEPLVSGQDATDRSSRAELDLRQVEFTYGDSEDRHFTLGPLDFSIRPGEVVYIVGGNGSGKSTLVKLLAGLYEPSQGEIALGDTVIEANNRDWYRQHFAIVFSDSYIFESLFGATRPDLDEICATYLEMLELSHKVKIESGVFSTIFLSQGQRKRLALLTALVEDRPIYIFDEWAADQDPQYKETFYMRFLPELKATGKAVIVITHDDRYFGTGDRVIRLEEGQVIVEDQAS